METDNLNMHPEFPILMEWKAKILGQLTIDQELKDEQDLLPELPEVH